MDGHTNPASPDVSGRALCVNEFDAHEWTLSAVGKLLERYPGFTGFHVEEPGHIKFDRCVCYRCQDVYSELYDEPGENLLNYVYGIYSPRYREDKKSIPVKVNGTNRFAENLDDLMADQHPDHVVSYNGSWSAKQDRARARNWSEWTEEGWVPYYSPQVYAFQTDTVVDQTQNAMKALDDEKSVAFPSLGIGWRWGENDPETVASQIEATRKLDGNADTSIAGVNLFSGMGLDGELVRILRDDPFASPTKLPWAGERSGDGGDARASPTPPEESRTPPGRMEERRENQSEILPSAQRRGHMDECDLAAREPLTDEHQSLKNLPGASRRTRADRRVSDGTDRRPDTDETGRQPESGGAGRHPDSDGTERRPR